jgi:prepilin-type N-terminal cleavage/methylation domain-containing protein
LRLGQSRREQAGGFTLIELLVSISIIGIIAAFSAGVVFTAQEAARRAATEALVSKLHSQMAMRWEDYATRRVGVQPLPPALAIQRDARIFAAQRLLAMQELMRLELPDQYIDVLNPDDGGAPAVVALQSVPSLNIAYRRRVSRQVADMQTAFEQVALANQSSECLYMIMTTGMIDASSSGDYFTDRDTGDTDGDGMLEFIDGWGRPIEWIRWPTAFLSDMQSGTVLGDEANGTQRVVRDVDANRDPFNPTLVDEQALAVGPRPNDIQWGYRLAPLIVSLGGDGYEGIHFLWYKVGAPNAEIVSKANDPYAVIDDDDYGPIRRGDIRPDPESQGRGYEDNIHNHIIGTR